MPCRCLSQAARCRIKFVLGFTGRTDPLPCNKLPWPSWLGVLASFGQACVVNAWLSLTTRLTICWPYAVFSTAHGQPPSRTDIP